jgi:hypothetical protein
MLREIIFTVTGEVRKPRSGDWFLNTKNFPVCAMQDFDVSRFPILKMEVVEDSDRKSSFMPNCARS